MQTYRNHLLALVVCALSLAPLAVAQPEQLIELQAAGARVFAASRAEVLGPNAGSATATVAAFLRSRNVPQAAVDSLVVEGGGAAPGAAVSHYRFKQRVQGLDVYGTYVKAAFNSSGDLVHLVELLGTPPAVLIRAVVTPSTALTAAARDLYPSQNFTFTEVARNGNTIEFTSGDTFFFKNPTVTRVAAPIAGVAMQEAFLVETWTGETNQLHHSLISASGRILLKELRTANENYSVYTIHPNAGPQTLMPGPLTGDPYSPQGWIGNTGRTAGIQYQFRMSGNNVDAYLDRNNNNSPDAAGATRSGPDFGTLVLTDQDPTILQNQEAAIAHLFFFNNVIHDKLYRHGFIESAGNFQEKNFGKGGAENDSVMAEAQDGGGTSNANFSTPSDGSRPRMQMYLWDRSSPWRDGDLDSDIVYHEYGHGLTWRMIGSMSGCMSGAVGEGVSDTLSILMNNNDVVGEYSYNSAIGIRRSPYTNYPRTYGDFTNEAVHAGGELFAAIMWRAKEKFTAENLSLDDLWQALVYGMNYIPAGPKYEHMRDGIVQAAGGTSTKAGCLIYKSFAEFGVGQGAVGSCTVSGFIFTRTTWNNTESFLVPSECDNPVEPAADIAITQIAAPSPVFTGTTGQTATVTVTNVGTAISESFTVSLEANNGGNVTTLPQTVPNLAAGASVQLSFTWTAPSNAATVTLTAWHNYGDNNAANNTLNANVVVQAAVTDLEVSSISAPSTSATSAQHTIGVTVRNAGNQNVTSTITVQLTANGGAVADSPKTIPGLAVGASGTVTFTWTAPSTAQTVTLTGSFTFADANGGNNSGTASVVVSQPAPISLTVTRVVNKGSRDAVLNWAGASTDPVIIKRNGTAVRSVPNSGTYIDTGLSRSTTYTFQVCESGGSTACSNVVTITM